jgi:cation:H+ antiporter
MLTYLFFILGFFFLIKGANFLIDGASSLAKKMKIPELVVGLTIVAFGTSMPEFAVNLFASFAHNSDLALGNIIGSNICNILLILGICAIISPLAVKRSTTWKEIPMSLLAAILVGIIGNDFLLNGGGHSGLSRIDGLVLIVFFAIFLYYISELTKNHREKTSPENKIQEYSTFKSIILVITGLIGLFLGGQWIVNGAVNVASLLGVSQSVIALTIVALGTSLPELAASAMATYRQKPDIAIGNVVGSNIFNIFWILGLSAVISPISFQQTNNVDIFVLIIANLLLFFSLFIGKKRIIERWQGIFFIIIYLLYVILLIVRK